MSTNRCTNTCLVGGMVTYATEAHARSRAPSWRSHHGASGPQLVPLGMFGLCRIGAGQAKFFTLVTVPTHTSKRQIYGCSASCENRRRVGAGRVRGPGDSRPHTRRLGGRCSAGLAVGR